MGTPNIYPYRDIYFSAFQAENCLVTPGDLS